MGDKGGDCMRGSSSYMHGGVNPIKPFCQSSRGGGTRA